MMMVGSPVLRTLADALGSRLERSYERNLDGTLRRSTSTVLSASETKSDSDS
jgi:hypothetical protein